MYSDYLFQSIIHSFPSHFHQRFVPIFLQAAQKSSLSTSSASMQEPAVAKPVTNPFQVKTSIQPFRRPTSSGNASEQAKVRTSLSFIVMLRQSVNKLSTVASK